MEINYSFFFCRFDKYSSCYDTDREEYEQNIKEKMSKSKDANSDNDKSEEEEMVKKANS